MMGYLKTDFKNNRSNYKVIFIIFFYRVAHFFSERRHIWWSIIIGFPIRLCYKILVEWILGTEIPASVKIGKGLKIHHGQCLVVNSKVLIGNNVTLKHNTTIGASVDLNDKFIAAPVIGNNVIIHPHTIIIGGITVGDNVIIGAGSVVLKDVEPNSVVAGNPAKKIKTLEMTVND